MEFTTTVLVASVFCGSLYGAGKRSISRMEMAWEVIRHTEPLVTEHSDRLPFIVWGLQGLQDADEDQLGSVLTALGERGIAPVIAWRYEARERELPNILRMARILQTLRVPVVINTTGVMHRFCDGDEKTAHVDVDGARFFDTSHSANVNIGCPFALEHRSSVIRAQVEFFISAFVAEGLPLDILIADWEIDGPIEWNDAWALGKRCARCREHIPTIDTDFAAFQTAYRKKRSHLQKSAYADVVLKAYPDALVGNYAEYPNDGFRYWYDYFEKEPTEQPFTLDQREPVRMWYPNFHETGYTFAMPVVYTWHRIFNWYDFVNPDFRWFYSMLKVATNGGRNAPPGLPVISFVHWHTTAPPKELDPAVKQMSEDAYQELLWHMLLRGHDGLAMWCRVPDEILKETVLVHEVYSESMQYTEFLSKGIPVAFDIPKVPGPVVSAMRLGKRLLVRRTDFNGTGQAVNLQLGEVTVPVEPCPGKCQLLTLPE